MIIGRRKIFQSVKKSHEKNPNHSQEMTCLLNTFGKFSNLENIIKFLSNSEDTSISDGLLEINQENNDLSNSIK